MKINYTLYTIHFLYTITWTPNLKYNVIFNHSNNERLSYKSNKAHAGLSAKNYHMLMKDIKENLNK